MQHAQGVALVECAHLTQLRWLQQPFTDQPVLRLNDANADVTSSIWAGSLSIDDELRSDGCLSPLRATGHLTKVHTGNVVANGTPTLYGLE